MAKRRSGMVWFVLAAISGVIALVLALSGPTPLVEEGLATEPSTMQMPAKCEYGTKTSEGVPSFPNCPDDMKSLFLRATGCAHFAGEDSYDAERAKFIANAVTRLRCDQLAADHAALLKRYANEAEVLAVFNAAVKKYEIDAGAPLAFE